MLVRRDLRHGESDGLLPVLLAQRISIRNWYQLLMLIWVQKKARVRRRSKSRTFPFRLRLGRLQQAAQNGTALWVVKRPRRLILCSPLYIFIT